MSSTWVGYILLTMFCSVLLLLMVAWFARSRLGRLQRLRLERWAEARR
jgi:hypothetical protein